MTKNYSILRQVKITADHLESNATIHSFIFGALAEIVDNSRDAEATYIKIFSVNRSDLRGGFMLYFLDDGHGMDPDQCIRNFYLGSSHKKTVKNMELIGRYGNGLKASSLRIASDFMLFTKKNSVLSICFLSRTFYKKEEIDQTDLYVAVPSFHADTYEPWFDVNEKDLELSRERHELEINLILKYSPFDTKQKLLDQFDKIDGSSGTLVVIFTLLLNYKSQPYIKIDFDKKDILLNETETQKEKEKEKEKKSGDLEEEEISFRKYVSILYTNPKMKVYIENSKVRPRIFEQTLYLPRAYKFTKAFTNSSKEEIELAEAIVKKTKRDLEDANSAFSHAKETVGQIAKKQNNELQKLNNRVVVLTDRLEDEEKYYNELLKMSKQEKVIEFKFGINLNQRAQAGCFFYNSNRLLKMYEKLGGQKKLDPDYRGIVGIINVPYSAMIPIHSKQGFKNDDEFKILKNAAEKFMDQYVRDIKIELNVKDDSLKDFWTDFGYLDDKCDIPSSEPRFVKKRLFKLPTIIQCDSCLKWRMWDNSPSDVDKNFPDNWCCEELRNCNCSTPQKLTEIKFGELKKVVDIVKPSENNNNINNKQKESSQNVVKQIENIKKPTENPKTRINPLEIAKQNSEKKLEELSAAKTPRISSNLTKKKTPVEASKIANSTTDKVNKITSRVIKEISQETNNRLNFKRTSDIYEYQSDDSSSSSQSKSRELNKRRREELQMPKLLKKPDISQKVNNITTANGKEVTKQIEARSSISIEKSTTNSSKNKLDIIMHKFAKYIRRDTNGDVLVEESSESAYKALVKNVKELLNSVSKNDSFNDIPDEIFVAFDLKKFICDKMPANQ